MLAFQSVEYKFGSLIFKLLIKVLNTAKVKFIMSTN